MRSPDRRKLAWGASFLALTVFVGAALLRYRRKSFSIRGLPEPDTPFTATDAGVEPAGRDIERPTGPERDQPSAFDLGVEAVKRKFQTASRAVNGAFQAVADLAGETWALAPKMRSHRPIASFLTLLAGGVALFYTACAFAILLYDVTEFLHKFGEELSLAEGIMFGGLLVAAIVAGRKECLKLGRGAWFVLFFLLTHPRAAFWLTGLLLGIAPAHAAA